MTTAPSWNRAPWTRSDCLMEFPSMKVPFVLPRSLSTNLFLENSMAECMRETAGSSMMMSEPVPRPMTVRPLVMEYSASFFRPRLDHQGRGIPLRNVEVLLVRIEPERTVLPGCRLVAVLLFLFSRPELIGLISLGYLISNTLPAPESSRMNWMVVSPTCTRSLFCETGLLHRSSVVQRAVRAAHVFEYERAVVKGYGTRAAARSGRL